jgi:hypothetical protein
MAIMNDIKGDGHSIVAPRASLGWVVYGVVAVVLLMIVLWIVNSGKKIVGGTVTGKTAGIGAVVSGAFGDGT